MGERLKPLMVRPSDCPVYANYCAEHGFTHGAEAEELREGIQNLISKWSTEAIEVGATYPERFVEVDRLRDLLDRVDARDSVAFREIPEKPKKTRKPKTTAKKVAAGLHAHFERTGQIRKR